MGVPPPNDPDNTFFDIKPSKAWTDGACKNQDNAEIRMAGAGIVYGFGHPSSKSWPLAGLEQTFVIAEIEAVLYILYWVTWPIDIYTGNEFVVDCVTFFINHPKTPNPYQNQSFRTNLMHKCIQDKPGISKMFKVKGHEKYKIGNPNLTHNDGMIMATYAADKLAVEGAEQHDWGSQ